MHFDQKNFLADVERVLHAEYACDIKSAGKFELYNAVSRAVMEEEIGRASCRERV